MLLKNKHTNIHRGPRNLKNFLSYVRGKHDAKTEK